MHPAARKTNDISEVSNPTGPTGRQDHWTLCGQECWAVLRKKTAAIPLSSPQPEQKQDAV